MTKHCSLRRFAAFELLLWASLYPAYLAIRGSSIEDNQQAIAHASSLVDLERAAGLFHETAVQKAAGSVIDVLSVYYMLGFGPLIAGVLIWLGFRNRPCIASCAPSYSRRWASRSSAIWRIPLRRRVWFPVWESATPSACPPTTRARSQAFASTPTQPCPACTSAGASSSPSSGSVRLAPPG